MVLKLLFTILSYLMTTLCIFAILRFQPKTNDFRKSILVMTVLYSLPSLVDMAMFFIVLTSFIPRGEYGTGVEILAAVINLAVLIPIYKLAGNKTYKKFKDAYPERKDLKAIQSLWKAAIIKAIFIMPIVVWIIEV